MMGMAGRMPQRPQMGPSPMTAGRPNPMAGFSAPMAPPPMGGPRGPSQAMPLGQVRGPVGPQYGGGSYSGMPAAASGPPPPGWQQHNNVPGVQVGGGGGGPASTPGSMGAQGMGGYQGPPQMMQNPNPGPSNYWTPQRMQNAQPMPLGGMGGGVQVAQGQPPPGGWGSGGAPGYYPPNPNLKADMPQVNFGGYNDVMGGQAQVAYPQGGPQGMSDAMMHPFAPRNQGAQGGGPMQTGVQGQMQGAMGGGMRPQRRFPGALGRGIMQAMAPPPPQMAPAGPNYAQRFASGWGG